MIRLWWFCLWLWEWFWHPQGMLVWAEANQGMLSIAALVTALVFFLLEQRRANRAEQAANDAARAAELKEQEKLRIQKIEARAHQQAEKRRQVSEFVAVTNDILDGFLTEGRNVVAESVAQNAFRPSIGFSAVWHEIVGALRMLAGQLPSRPRLTTPISASD